MKLRHALDPGKAELLDLIRLQNQPFQPPGDTDWTGIVETELFAQTYRTYGLATIRYPVLEIEAKVEPFENKRGFSLRVLRAGSPRNVVG